MLKSAVLFCAFAVGLSALVAAKPLIVSSEAAVEKICIDYSATIEEIVLACQHALENPGLTNDQKVQLSHRLGDAHSNSNNEELAITKYELALDIQPENVGVLTSRGWSLRADGQDLAAYDAFKKAVGIQPTGQGLAGLAATTIDTGNGTLEEALQYFDGATALTLDYSWAYREKAWRLNDAGRFEDAEMAFAQALDIDRLDENANYGMARSLLEQRKFEPALNYINASINSNADGWWKYSTRSVILRSMDRNGQAVREAQRAIEMAPANSEGYVQKARALYNLGKRKQAFDELENAQATIGIDGFLLYWYAHMLQSDAQFELAMQKIEKVISSNDVTYHDHELKAFIALELNDYETALIAAERSTEMEPTSSYSHFYAAIAMVHTGNILAAQSRFERAMSLKPEDFMLGDFAAELISKGKFVEAIELRLKYTK
jgi:tetratricopeptide (TPR) repeat protein